MTEGSGQSLNCEAVIPAGSLREAIKLTVIFLSEFEKLQKCVCEYHDFRTQGSD